MFSFIIDIFKALNPEMAPNEPKHTFRWRQTVAFMMVVLTGLSIFNLSQANGWLSWMGVPGYVTVAAINNTQQLVRDTREDQLVQQILDMVRRYCLAYDAGDQSGAAFAFQGLQAARSKYFNLMGREYPQLMCSMSAQPARPTSTQPVPVP